MTQIRHHFIQTNGIRMHVAEAGEGFPVVLCHGFPELWYSWRHQIAALSEAGFDDIAGLLDALQIPKAVIVGHDWGGMTSWYFGLRHPDRTERLVGLNTPFIPPGPVSMLKGLPVLYGLPPERFYMNYFQEPGVAEAELSADVRETFRKVMRSAKYAQDLWTFATVGGDGSGVLTHIGPGETLLSDEELEVYAKTFERTGFRGGLNWYRAIEASWREDRTLPSFMIQAPSMMVTAEKDLILRPAMAQPMRPLVPNLRMEHLEDCAHWTQQEKANEVNALLLDFLKDLRVSAGAASRR